MALGEIIRKKERSEIRFSDKIRPKKAVFSLLLAALSLILMAAMIILSALAKGEAPLYVGAGGAAALVLSFLGFILALRCFRLENIYYGMPVAGSLLNGVVMLAWLAVYVGGFL